MVPKWFQFVSHRGGTSKRRVNIGEDSKLMKAIYGIAIRIDNPNFEGDTVNYPNSFMFGFKPRYLYGEITRIDLGIRYDTTINALVKYLNIKD